ncbi:hypothetical protein F4781DRAFT_427478 [Annulohypoxylon bovei var. microspora]|nr:hypothetical protein F4781DRAFT_427478 [Annulohypoxylon bovei var. microspora]
MSDNHTEKLVRLNQALAAAANSGRGGSAKVLIPTFVPPRLELMRKCEVCTYSFSYIVVPAVSFEDDTFPSYTCYGCRLLTSAQQSQEKAPYWSAILNYWRPETDCRAFQFVLLEQNSIPLLSCLRELAMHYTWKEVTDMVNIMVVERLRHGPNTSRRAIEVDFFNVLETCRYMEFAKTFPDELNAHELMHAKLVLGNFGFVVPQPGTESDELVTNFCSYGWMCLNSLPCRDRIVFTYAYRNRRGCDIRIFRADGS